MLRQAGYFLAAIGRRVIVPVDATKLAALVQVTESTDRSHVHPDLWLKHGTDAVDPIIELKGHGFSPESSTARQAAKLLISAADLSPSLGTVGSTLGHVIYATTASDAADLGDTLHSLSESFREHNVEVAPSGTLGFTMLVDGVGLMSPKPASLPRPMGVALAVPAVVLRSATDDSLRPLYFVPWIPGIEGSQAPELQAEGLRELTARMLTHAIAIIGQAQVPDTVVMSGTVLLDRATFGVYSRWRDRDGPKFAAAAARIIHRSLKSLGSRMPDQFHVELDLPTTDAQDAAVERLERSDPSDPAKNLSAALHEPPTLFDDPPDETVTPSNDDSLT